MGQRKALLQQMVTEKQYRVGEVRMLMSKETIVMLYKKALEDGDPVRQIKSLAKTNGVKATVIKNILIEEGLEVPEKIPTGPMKAAAINEDFENEVQDMIKRSENRQAMPDVVKDAISLGIESMSEKIESQEREVMALQESLAELKEKKRSVEECMKRSPG